MSSAQRKSQRKQLTEGEVPASDIPPFTSSTANTPLSSILNSNGSLADIARLQKPQTRNSCTDVRKFYEHSLGSDLELVYGEEVISEDEVILLNSDCRSTNSLGITDYIASCGDSMGGDSAFVENSNFFYRTGSHLFLNEENEGYNHLSLGLITTETGNDEGVNTINQLSALSSERTSEYIFGNEDDGVLFVARSQRSTPVEVEEEPVIVSDSSSECSSLSEVENDGKQFENREHIWQLFTSILEFLGLNSTRDNLEQEEQTDFNVISTYII